MISLHPLISNVINSLRRLSFSNSDFIDISVIFTRPYTERRFNLFKYFDTPSTIDLSERFKHQVRLKYFRFTKLRDISMTDSSINNLHPQKSKNYILDIFIEALARA